MAKNWTVLRTGESFDSSVPIETSINGNPVLLYQGRVFEEVGHNAYDDDCLEVTVDSDDEVPPTPDEISKIFQQEDLNSYDDYDDDDDDFE